MEIPFIEQLKALGWDHIEGDIDVPYLTERESFRDALLNSSVFFGMLACRSSWSEGKVVTPVEAISEKTLINIIIGISFSAQKQKNERLRHVESGKGA